LEYENKKKKELINFLKKNELYQLKRTDYNLCSTARENNNMCGEEAIHFKDKLKFIDISKF
jgi:hypothetical protein